MNLFEFLDASFTQYHAIKNIANVLTENGFTFLDEAKNWELKKGGKYFTVRNGSSLIAFVLPQNTVSGYMITGSHSDSPCFKIKENTELNDSYYLRLSSEKYGGMLIAPWLDRPLGIAGRVVVKTASGLESRLVDFGGVCAIMPNVASHLNRGANDGYAYNAAVDSVAMYKNSAKGSLKADLARLAGVNEADVKSSDVQLYCAEKAERIGEYICSGRLDDLQCVYSCLNGFVASDKSTDKVKMLAVFDNEEVGSETKQGADSSFMTDTVTRICEAFGISSGERAKLFANSMMLSCDNAHAVHPNHPEHSDLNNCIYMNKGVVIKYNANQAYTSDAVSSGIFKMICESVGVPYQLYANRADKGSGSTLGNIANTHISLKTVDIGLAQLAMHSCYETAGADDTDYMMTAVKKFYDTSINCDGDKIVLK